MSVRIRSGWQRRGAESRLAGAGFGVFHQANGFVVPSNPGLDEMNWNAGLSYHLGLSQRDLSPFSDTRSTTVSGTASLVYRRGRITDESRRRRCGTGRHIWRKRKPAVAEAHQRVTGGVVDSTSRVTHPPIQRGCAAAGSYEEYDISRMAPLR